MSGAIVVGATPVEDRPAGGAGGEPDGPYREYDVFADWGVEALVTTRAAGSFSTGSEEAVGVVLGRWDALQQHVASAGVARFATARQVHGPELLVHAEGWRGWLRGPEADGHVAPQRGTATAVTIADCVPVYLAHPSGATALLHSGWRGTEANILARAVRALADAGHLASDLRLLLGPAICGDCYEVSADVYARLTGRHAVRPARVDLRAVIARQAHSLGVGAVFAADACTRCDQARYYSHRGGDGGRQLAVLFAPPTRTAAGAPASMTRTGH
jgi:YfiH family protein